MLGNILQFIALIFMLMLLLGDIDISVITTKDNKTKTTKIKKKENK